MNTAWLLKKFREYEIHYMGDSHDHVEWRHEFLEFVAWLMENRMDIIKGDVVNLEETTFAIVCDDGSLAIMTGCKIIGEGWNYDDKVALSPEGAKVLYALLVRYAQLYT